MPRLIVNADDFGMSPGANLGILRAHQHGIVTSATLMVNMPGAAEAMQIAGATPTLGVGIHMTLTAGRPLLADVPSLIDGNGRFRKLPDLALHGDPAEMERELRAQVAAFRAAGLRPTHLDSHHHIHLEVPAVGAILLQLGAELGIPVRARLTAPDLIIRFYGLSEVTVANLQAILAGLAPDSASEIMCHPAYLDPEILQGSSYNIQRVHELATLTAPAIQQAVADNRIRLVSYRDLA